MLLKNWNLIDKYTQYYSFINSDSKEYPKATCCLTHSDGVKKFEIEISGFRIDKNDKLKAYFIETGSKPIIVDEHILYISDCDDPELMNLIRLSNAGRSLSKLLLENVESSSDRD